uniref:Type II and III secretion system protein n=1 Tax=Schlesneria paludicola TaxID=360056 RepID=A0A7C2NZA2_9PLAN
MSMIAKPSRQPRRQSVLGLISRAAFGWWLMVSAACAQGFPTVPPAYGNEPAAASASGGPLLGPSFGAPAVDGAAGAPAEPVIQAVQNTPESARRVHQLIETLPDTHEDLEIIERRSQLMTTRANITRIQIADPAIVDVVQYSPRELSLIGLARGSTTLMLWFEGFNEPIIYLVKTIRDPNLDNQRRIDYGKLEKKINTLFPNSKVYLIPMSWKIIVRGQARDQEEAAHILAIVRGEIINQEGGLFGPQPRGVDPGAFAYGGVGGVGSGYDTLYGGFGGVYGGGLWASYIINELRVPGEFQISLRVRIAELNRSQAREMGVDLSVLFNDTQLLFTNLGAGAAATIGGIFEGGDISVLLNWLASNGTAKILTEPNVVVISGREARFLAGGEFAVPTTVGIGGAQGQTTSFRGFGTSLLVTPTVIDRDLIRITANAEYSDLNNGATVGGIPGTSTRRVETTVELREGQTLALAGLLSHRTITEVTRIPGLGDIPKIGPLLFSTKRATQEENELLILITPEIVRPMDPHEVPPVPGFEVTHPMDHELYKHNMTEGMPDTGYYQTPPYGSGSVGTNVGYQHFNPGPAGSMYSPQPTNPYGTGFSSPGPVPNGMPSGPATAVPPYSVPSAPPASSPQPLPGSAQWAPGPGPGWSRPAGSPQTIQPVNYAQPGGPISPNAQPASRSVRPGYR